MIRRFIAWLALFASLCLVGEAATIVGPIYQTYSNRPYSGPILMRPLSTPQANTPNLLTGGDFIVRTDTNGLFSVDLQPGNYRVQVGADRPFIIDVPTNAASYTLLERITNALAWNSSIIPATNSYALSLTTRSGVVKSTSDQADPVAWLTNDTATIGKWLGNITANTIDELIATTAPTYDVDNIVVNGWVTEQDGRGGDWYYDYGATTTTNTGMVVAWGSGRLLRKWGMEVDPKWFGANESCGADATTAMQAAIDFAADPTYGWQASTGQTGQTGFTVLFPGCYITSADLIPKGAVEIKGPKRGSGAGDFGANGTIHVKHSGNGFTWDAGGDSGLNRTPTIRDLYIVGYSETYQANKKTITGVSSRTVFTVADADAPPTLEDPAIYASNNTCFFFDQEGGYLGSGRIASTSSSAGTTTVTLATGSDAYTSVNGASGNLLTTACKVVWPVRVTAESSGSVGDFNDPASAGSCAIFLKNTTSTVFGVPRIDNIYATRFHAGLRIGPKLLGAQNGGFKDLRFLNTKFAGIATPRPPNTADMFFQGVMYTSGYYAADYGTTRTNTADVAALRYSTYGIWGVPNLSKWDSVLVEESAYANLYAFRVIGPSFGYLFSDGVIRYGIALGPGYYAYSSPTTSAYDNWVSVGRLHIKNQLDSLTIDTIHTDQTGVYFELTDTAKFAAVAIDQLHVIKSGTTHPAITAFDLQASAYNNRAKIGTIAERNGFATWSKSGSKFPEVDTPNFTTAAEVNTGFYDASSVQRDYAVSGTRLMSLTSGNVLLEKAGGSQLFTLKNTTSGSAIASSIGTGSLAWDNTADSLRLGAISSDSSQATLFLGSSGATTNARASLIKAETVSGSAGVTNGAAGTLLIYGSGGTGDSSTGGAIEFYTADVGSSGTSAQSFTRKIQIPRTGGVRLTGSSADISGIAAGQLNYVAGSLNSHRLFDGSYWQPLSIQSAETTIASAGSINIAFQTTDKIYITGTTTINSFGVGTAGTRRNVRFEDALTLTYNATSMILPTGASITTAAGDTLEAHCISSGNWRVVWYQRASGHALAGGGGGGGGSGDVVGPSSATDNAVVRFDGTTGKLVQNSAVTIADTTGDITAGKYNTVAISGSSTPTLAVTGTSSISGSNTGDQSGANPSASIGLSAVNGVATTFMRSDAAPALDLSIAPTWTGAHTFSKNGALSLPTFSVTGTPITGGTATTTKPLALIETAGATSTGWSTSGTMLGINAPSGFAGRMLDVHLNGVSYMSLTSGGTLTAAAGVTAGGSVTAGAAQNLAWLGRSEMLSPSDGVILLQNAANSDFTRLQLGGTTTSFPAIERSGTTVAIKLADGSADAPLTASSVTATTFNGALSGNASTATTLQTARSINGVSFNGSADITVTAAAGTLTGSTLASGVTASSLTSVGTITSGTWQGSTIAVNKGGTGATTASGALDALNVAETTVASATTTDLGAVASDKVSITGTTTITSFGTATAGVKREGRFTGALTLTHNATSLIIPGGASLTTAAGDRFGAYSLGSGNWVVTYYTKADGTAIVGGAGGSVATDTIWDAAGDLAVGTGSNTASRLAAGDYGGVLTANGASTALFYATPNNVVTVMEHFLSHLASSTIFSEVFSSVSSTSGTGNDKDHPGVYSISTGSSASSTGYLRVGNSSGTLQIGGGVIVYEQAIRIPTLSDGTQTFTAHFGFSEALYGASFSGNHHIKMIHDNTSGNWQTSVKNGGTTTSSTSSTAVSMGWQKIRIVVNADRTSVAFFVNGTELNTSPITTNIPDNTDAMTIGWGITKSAGTTARTIDTDYVYFYQKLTNPL